MENKEALVSDILEYIESNLEEDLTIDEIAGKFYFNRHYVMKLFKKTTGITITQYMNYQKIKNSIDPLVHTDDKILKIALTNGFHSLEYYSETFYKVIGMSPNKFRKCGISLLPPERNDLDMEKTRLQKIQVDIEELKKLRSEILGLDEKEEIKSDIPKTKEDAPKVYCLQRETKKVA